MGPAGAVSIGGLVRRRPRGGLGHAVVVPFVGVIVLLAEASTLSLDHGTHLLVALVLAAGVAVLAGPALAISALAVGGVAAIAMSAPVLGDASGLHLTSIQVAIYLAAGAAIVALSFLASRARGTRPGSPGLSTSVPVHAQVHERLVEPLTERELEVLRLAASGISVDAIGARLYLSPNTVKTHLTHAYAKLGVRGRSDAIRAALHFGCLTPADICPHRYPPQDIEIPGSNEAAHRNG